MNTSLSNNGYKVRKSDISMKELKEIKDELKSLTNEAFEKDIFGAPTFVVNNKIFWGQDRIEFALKEAGK